MTLANRRNRLEGLDGAFSHGRAKLLGQALRDVFATRVIDDFLGLDDVARDVIQIAQLVGQAEFHRLLAAPEKAAEHFGRFLQALTAAGFDHRDELLVNLVQHDLRKGALTFALRAEGIEKAFVFTGGLQPALHAQLVHQAGKAEAVHQYADAADDAGFVDKYLVSRHGDVVSGRCAGFFLHGVDRLFVQGLQTQDFVIHHAGLNRAATRRIYQQHDSPGALVFKRRTQRRIDKLGAGVGIGSDFTLDLDRKS